MLDSCGDKTVMSGDWPRAFEAAAAALRHLVIPPLSFYGLLAPTIGLQEGRFTVLEACTVSNSNAKMLKNNSVHCCTLISA